MTPEQFTYWLQGFCELTDGQPPTPEQWKSIHEHLKTVFQKVTPPVYRPMTPNPAAPSPLPTFPKPWLDDPFGPRVIC
jgi:hypothetical protein